MREIARGVTDPLVGSGALLGRLSRTRNPIFNPADIALLSGKEYMQIGRLSQQTGIPK